MVNHWMFRCKDVSILISRSMDEKLPVWVRLGIKFHLMMCHLCSNYKDQLYFIRNAVSKMEININTHTALTPLPDQARDRIQRYLKDLE